MNMPSVVDLPFLLHEPHWNISLHFVFDKIYWNVFTSVSRCVDR